MNNVERTSLRSATHATDSTWRGWIAKSAATTALRHLAAVMSASTRNNSTTFTTWSRRFTK